MTTPCLPGFFDQGPPVDAQHRPHHDGATYQPALDHARLNAQTLRVWTVMTDGQWRTLRQLSELTGDPEASVSARLRDLRKRRFGGHLVERRRTSGLFEYRLGPSRQETR